MADELIELAAKDVFVLLNVPVPDNLDNVNKWQELGDSKDDENDSQFTLEDDDRVQFNAVTEPPVIDITPPEDLDYSSTDSLSEFEINERRWYKPNSTEGIERSDFNFLKEALESIKNTAPTETLAALTLLKKERIVEEAYQNMFIAQNGFEVLINILDCNNDDCMKESLNIIHEMSQQYGAQCALCTLDVVKPLIGILVFKRIATVRYMAADTLQNIARLRRGRKLIRISNGIRFIVQSMMVPKKVLATSPKDLYGSDQVLVRLVNSCAGALRLLCRSLKSQEVLWNTGFITMVPQLLYTQHSDIQVNILGLVAECCRMRPKVPNQKMNILYKEYLKDMHLLPTVIKFMLSSISEHAAKAAELILSLLEDDPNTYDSLLRNKGMEVIFKAIKKFHNESSVMVSVMTVLWKCALNAKCRQIIERDGIISYLIELLSYEFDDRVIGYTVATLSELWACPNLQIEIKHKALPIFLQLLGTSLHSQILAHVCTAMGRVSIDPECMEMINEANGFQLIFALLPSLEVEEFDKYDDFFEQETTISAAKCLVKMNKNSSPDVNNMKGMLETLYDLVDLLTHRNLDIVAEVCRVIEVVAIFDENLNIMVDAGVIENLTNLVTTKHVNLRANLCRALGKCCRGGATARDLSCKTIVEQLFKYTRSKHQVIRDNVPLALSGLSEDPLNCVKIEALGFLPFIKQSVKSENSETAEAAVNCMRNVRKVCTAIGEYQECVQKI